MGPDPTPPVRSDVVDSEGNARRDSTIVQEEENSKAIRYRILYKNDAGEPIKEDEQYKPWPKLMTADEEGLAEADSVLDIVTYVTIRQIAVSNPINSQSGATDAGSTPTSTNKDAEKKPPQGKGLKSQNLEISSIGTTEMVIRSKRLCDAIRKVVDYYPSQQLNGNITVAEPYHFLLHHREDLRRMMKTGNEGQDAGAFHGLEPKKTSSDIEVLLAFLDAKYAKKIEDEEARHKKNPPTATFEMLWMLLRPGTRVYTDVNGELAAFVINSMSSEKKSNPGWISIGLWYLDFDGRLRLTYASGQSLNIVIGRRIGRCTTAVTSFSFSGEQEISSLKVFPADMASDKSLRPRLEKAGEHYFNVLRQGSQQVNYDGYSLGKTKRYVSMICMI